MSDSRSRLGLQPGRAVVTGASRGIGRAVSTRLVEDGWSVTACGRDTERLGELAASTGCDTAAFDTSDLSSVQAAAQAQLSSGETPDLLVLSAGVFGLCPLHETPAELLDQQLDANLRGPFHVIRAFLPAMLARGAGLVVNIGSVSGRRAFPANGAYSASKFGLRGLHEVLVEEVRGTGVRASLVEPGAVDTSIWDPINPDERDDLPSRAQMLRPGDVAGAVSFLAGLPGHVSVPLLQIERA
ncbi:MAG: SDR family oxidoreductase [Gemmatimonadetes bacterium]|nr:SDR family oxidoreductase [Gemmatimonadota bacterium]